MTRSLTEQEAAFYRNTGEWIRTRRRKKKISTVKLGKRLGVNRNSVMRWEAGRPLSAWMYVQVYEALKPKETAA